jgi:hypothetical protein
VIYIDPQNYTKLSLAEKFDVARIIGRLNKLVENREERPTPSSDRTLGTTTPAMGVPVTFSEINNITAIAEIAYRDGSLIPDLSFGTHFFQDLVEMEIFYMAIYPDKENVYFNPAWLSAFPNRLAELSPRDGAYGEVVRVCNVRERNLRLMSNVVTQKLIVYARE